MLSMAVARFCQAFTALPAPAAMNLPVVAAAAMPPLAVSRPPAFMPGLATSADLLA
ncbi:hypothetical protein AAHR73_004248, partial [Yersinia enterocolitica]